VYPARVCQPETFNMVEGGMDGEDTEHAHALTSAASGAFMFPGTAVKNLTSKLT